MQFYILQNKGTFSSDHWRKHKYAMKKYTLYLIFGALMHQGHVTMAAIATAKVGHILKDSVGANIACSTTPQCRHSTEWLAECLIDPNNNNGSVCACDGINYHLHTFGNDSRCVVRAKLDGRCEMPAMSTVCEANTVCKEKMINHRTLKRCACLADMQVVRLPDFTKKCGKPISGPDCAGCLENDGKCFRLHGGGTAAFCQCPGSMSGINCEIKHANVHCKNKTMFVCYNPHPGYDLNGTSVIEVMNVHITGRVVDDTDDTCKAGDAKLALSLEDKLRASYGVVRLVYDDFNILYETSLVAHMKGSWSSEPHESIVFKTFCKIQYQTARTLGPMVVKDSGVEVGRVGVTSFAAVNLVVENSAGRNIGSGTNVEIGDQVKLVISLDKASGYTALAARYVILSTSKFLDDPDAVSKRILTDGCPEPGQSFLTVNNTFVTVPHRSAIKTGNIILQLLQVGKYAIYVHVKLQVCLAGFGAHCQQPVCGAGGRRKRDVGNGTTPREAEKQVDLMQKVTMNNPDEGLNRGIMDKGTFVTALCVILVAIILAFVFAVVLGARYWRRRQQAKKQQLVVPVPRGGVPPPPYTTTPGQTNKAYETGQMRSYATSAVM